jgi:hypothetical protein
MAEDPPKRKGRPPGSFDKSRDYRAAVARMRALIDAEGAAPRAAAATVHKETGIPLSTLRRHLDNAPPPYRPGTFDLAHLDDFLEIVPVPVPTEEEIERQRAEYLRDAEQVREKAATRQREFFSLHPSGPPSPLRRSPLPRRRK